MFAGAARVGVTGRIALVLGGGVVASVLACLAVLFAPAFVASRRTAFVSRSSRGRGHVFDRRGRQTARGTEGQGIACGYSQPRATTLMANGALVYMGNNNEANNDDWIKARLGALL
jgi:hypothetical protein